MSGTPLPEERAAAGERLPLVGVTCCARPFGESVGHTVVEKYILAVSEGAGGLPLLVPALGRDIPPSAVAARLDGLLVTGARSNVEPHQYDGEPSLPDTLHDPARDSMTLPLLRAAVAGGVPVLAICRGIQELNVALGGTLHQRLHELPGHLDHRAPQGTVDERYAYEAHEVQLAPNGLFARLAGARRLVVNSLHWQGIDRLAPGLVVEATAPDGQIEGVRLPGARFVVGVQWHPEYRFGDNPFSRALFAAFGEACRAYAAGRRAA